MELGKRELGGIILSCCFYSMNLMIPLPASVSSRNVKSRAPPPGESLDSYIQGWSLRDAITLSQCYILFPPHGINHSRAPPLCPPLSQDLQGSNKLLYQSDWMTHSFQLERTDAAQILARGGMRGMSHRCTLRHTKPALTVPTLSPPHRVLENIWVSFRTQYLKIENPKGNLNILWPWVVLLLIF